MMIPILVADAYGPQPTTSGIGKDSEKLFEIMQSVSEHFIEPLNMSAWREAVITFTELPSKHSSNNWDGEDASAMSSESWNAAQKALGLLFRACVKPPEIVVDPDGEIAFEWARPGRSVIFTFQKNGRLSHTALYNGVQEQPGTIVFTEAIPAVLMDKIARVYRAGH